MQFTWNKADDPSCEEYYQDERNCIECNHWFVTTSDVERCQECQTAHEMRGEEE